MDLIMKADEIIKSYIATRDAIADMEAAHKESLKPLKAQLAQLEQDMLGILAQSGSESMRTKEGTAYVSEKVSVSCADKSAFLDFIRMNEAFDLLDIRPNKTAVQDFLIENQELPPGVNVRRETACNFRRA